MAKIKDEWYRIEPVQSLERLGSGFNGLSSAEAGKRIAEYGRNELRRAPKNAPWRLFLEQFKNLLIIVLLAAVILAAILGETVDAIVIFIIILFAAVLGFIQEYRAERSIEALKKMAAPTARVIRDGQARDIAAVELVPGDLVLLKTGDRIPADGRVIEAFNLKTDEASLTGESLSVEKNTMPLDKEAGIGDRVNMVFAGTSVSYGRGSAVITSTGMETEFGKIAGLLDSVKKESTPLQINLARMSRWIVFGALGLTFIMALMGIARGHDWLEMLLWGVSLAVAAVPEALPAVVTVSLSLGVQKMARRNALIRRLPAVETLGSTTYICSDKTGTLTQDQMTVQVIAAGNMLFRIEGTGYEPSGGFLANGKKVNPISSPALQRLLVAGALCGDTTLINKGGAWDIEGDPTEGALVVAAAKAGLKREELARDNPRIREIPFTSESKRMTTVHETAEGRIALAKGAAEVLLQASRYVLIDGKETEIDSAMRDYILNQAKNMADKALRVLGLAYKKVVYDESDGEIQRNMVFLGLAGMIDPPRPEVKEALETCEAAGIRTVMITGDHKATAVAIARDLGLLKGGLAYSGDELDNMSREQFESQVENIDVYARVSPSHKLRVVDALTRRGHVVAMTGDGINDAPALKKADIGIAMGITGTDVTKEAAGMILTDDNFASIVAAVEEGRGIFANIKKYLVFLLSCNLGEILLMASAILLGPVIGITNGLLPLVAIQILYLNLATDGLPAIALSIDPPEPDLMKQKPRPRNQNIFTGSVLLYLIVAGIWTAGVALGVFAWAINSGRSVQDAQSLCFVTLVFIEFFNALNCRSLDHSLFQIGVFKNRWLWWAILWECALLLVIVYVPALHEPFNTFPLAWWEWIVALLSASTIFIGLEVFKLAKKRLKQNRQVDRKDSQDEPK